MNFLFAFIWLPLDSALALYATLFAVLILSGVGLPIPEEVTLLLGGYLAYLGFIDFWQVFYVLTLGIIAADLLGYMLGRFAGDWLSEKVSRFTVLSLLLKKAESYFEKHGEKVVLFSRPFLGVRVAVPIFAGHFKMNFAKFLIFDAIGAIPWTFFLVSISYYLGSGLDLITEVKDVKHLIIGLVALAIASYAGVKFIKTKKLQV